MADDKKTTVSRRVPPMQVPIIGTGDGSRMASGTEVVTPGAHEPNVVFTVVTPLVAVLIRAINTFLTTLVGIITAASATNLIPWTTFTDLVVKGSMIALVPTALGMIKDAVTIFSKLEQKYPLATGSI